MLIGYARVSTTDRQDTSVQADVLRQAGVDRVFEEHASGGRWDCPQLHRVIDFLRPGDTVVVWKLDRLSRSLKDLLHIMELIGQRQAGFRSLTEAVDTTAPAGRMLMQLLGSFAEFEREMIRERTRIGLDAARSRGVRIGKPKKLNDEQRHEVVEMVSSGRKIAAETARLFKVSGATVSRILAAARQCHQEREQASLEE
jgi:DNA invertase Pin-like site-specific DNA recombinase